MSQDAVAAVDRPLRWSARWGAGRWRFALCVALLGAAVIARGSVWWVPVGDHALTRIWTAAVGGAHTPLVGGDARYGWNHLGPWLFYLYAVPYRLLGASSNGILLGAGAINLTAVYLVARAGRAAAGRFAGALVGAAAVLSILTAGGPRLVDPWNPYVVEIPLLAAIVSCWAVLNGQVAWFACLIGAGSLAVQAHITYLPPVACLVVVALAGMAAARRRPTRREVVLSAVVGAVAWAPPALDLVLPGHHNIAHVAYFFVAKPSPGGRGIAGGLQVLLRQTGLSSEWLGLRIPLDALTQAFDGGLGLLPGLGLLVAAGTAVQAIRRRDRVAGALLVIVAALSLTAIAEMSAGTGPLFPYLFGWVSLVGMLATLSPLLAWAARAARDAAGREVAEPPVLVRRGTAAAESAGIGFAVALLWTGVGAAPPRSPLEQEGDARRVEQAVAVVAGKLVPGERYRLLHGSDTFNSVFELGVVSELMRRGTRIVVEPSARILFGRQMTDPLATTYPSIAVVVPYLGDVPTMEPLVVDDALDPARRARERQLTDSLSATFLARGDQRAAGVITSPDRDIRSLIREPGNERISGELSELAALRGSGPPFAVLLTGPVPGVPGR